MWWVIKCQILQHKYCELKWIKAIKGAKVWQGFVIHDLVMFLCASSKFLARYGCGIIYGVTILTRIPGRLVCPHGFDPCNLQIEWSFTLYIVTLSVLQWRSPCIHSKPETNHL